MRHLFIPPLFDDESKTFTARLLFAIAWIAIAGTLAANFFNIVASPDSLARSIILGAFGLLISFIILIITRRGHIRLASVLLMSGLWCLTTVGIFTQGGLSAPGLLTYPPLIFATGLLLGEAAGLGMVAVCTLAGGVMWYLADTGQLPPPRQPSTALNLWLVTVSISFVLWLLQSLVSRTVRGALQRARASEAQYRQLFEGAPLGIVTLDDKDQVQLINPGAARILGYDPAEMVGRNIATFIEPAHLKQLPLATQQGLLTNGESVQRERVFVHKNGSPVWVYGIAKRMPNGQIQYVFSDYTERHAALESVRTNEARFRMLIQHLNVGVLLQNQRAEILVSNQAALDMLGLTEEQLLGKSSFDPSWNVIHEDGSPFPGPAHPVPEAIATGQPVRDVVMGVYRPMYADRVWLLVNAVPQLDASGGVTEVICTFADVTHQKRQEKIREILYQISESAHTVQSLEELLHSIHAIINTVIPANNFYLAFYDQGQQCLTFPYAVDEFDTDWSPQPLRRGLTEYVLRTGQPLLAPPAVFQSLLEAGEVDDIGPPSVDWLGVPLLHAGDRVFGVLVTQTYSKTTRYTEADKDLLVYVSTQVAAAIERQRAAIALRESEERFRALIENSIDGISLIDAKGLVTYTSPASKAILGFDVDELIGQNGFQWLHPDDLDAALATFGNMAQQPANVLVNSTFRYRHKNGTWRWIESDVRNLLADPHIGAIVANFRDVTERKRHEQEQAAIVTMASALRTAQSRAEMLPVLLDELAVLLGANGTGLDMIDPATDEVVTELARGEWAAITGARNPLNTGLSRHVLTSGQTYVQDNIQQHPDLLYPDLYGAIQFVACAPLIVRDQTIGVLWAGWHSRAQAENLHLLPAISDIAANAIHRATLHEQTEQRLKRLIALHKIDTAITASFDLATTLQTVLDQAMTELHISAAAILIRQPDTQELLCAVSRGFKSDLVDQTVLPPTDPLTAPILSGHCSRGSIDLKNEALMPARAAMLTNENFLNYYGAPIIVKSEVKAVLEVWLREPTKIEAEWIDFLETLAGQAAIAIENYELFDQLQRTNLDLTTAYDATIEGWSRALDLRDHETEGHTQRVTAMALQLARAMGLSNKELLHVRWGSLLHDIGKMGVPDEVLLKPGPLSVNEWAIMRRHPIYARQMLMPITYLKPAIDIAYCHHERWDGSGYPQGLKGEAIPLAARIFAVVDVWDALRSDRPYRGSWSVEQTRDYIQFQSGKQFDPQVVAVFLNLSIGA